MNLSNTTQPKIFIKKIFDKHAAGYARFSNKYFADRRGTEVSKISYGLMLEVGAGCGLITENLVKRGSVIACDISLAMIREIKKKYAIPVIVADAESLPFKNNIFDTIISAEILYYLPAPQSFFDEAKRVLKKGGVGVTSCINKTWSLLIRVRNFLIKLGIRIGMVDSPPSYFYNWQIRAMYRKAGFEKICSKGIILLPFRKLDKLNTYLEKLPLQKLALCNIVWGRLYSK